MKQYEEFEMQLISVSAQDIVTLSPFEGEDDDFGDPNTTF